MTQRDRVLKWLVYALGVVPVWIAETMFLNRVPLFGVIPVLLPLTGAAVALWEGAFPGAAFGLCLGVVADAVYPGVPGGMTLGLALLGLLIGAVSQYGVRQSFVGYLLCAGLDLGMLELFRIAAALASGLGDNIAGPAAILWVALKEALWSLAFTPLIYGLFKLIYSKVGGERLGG